MTTATPLLGNEPGPGLPASEQVQLGSDPPAMPDDGVDVQVSRSLPPASAAWRSAATAAVAARAVLISVAYLAAWLLADGSGPFREGALGIWNKWDASHLLTIAQHGYFAPESDAHAAAFFPLFPMVTGLLLRVLGEPVVAGMIVSGVAAVVAGRYLYGLSEMEQVGSGRRAVVYLAFFPTALFLVAPYTEAMFIAGATAAFYFAKQKRWLLVALPAAIAVGTRAAGVFLLAGLAVEFLAQREFARDKVRDAATALVAGFLPLVAYFIYLQQRTGNLFYYFQMQEEGWGRSFTDPRASFLLTWRTWNDATATNWMMVWRLEIIAALLGLLAVGWAWHRREWGYATYMGLSLAALLTSTWYFSIPRMMLSFFPIALFMATARRIPHDYALAAFVGFATLGAVVYTKGAWFF